MKTLSNTKKWSEKDKFQLWISYDMGCSLQLICKLLDRSNTSINKALERFKIRPRGSCPPGPRPLYKRKAVTYFDAFSKFKELDLMQTFPKQKILSTLFPTHQPPWSTTRHSPKIHSSRPNTERYTAFPPNKPLRRRRNDRFTPETWVMLPTVIQYLRDKGFKIKVEPQKSSEVVFFLGLERMTPAQLLLIANRIRIAEGAAIYYVHNLTE